MVNPLNICAGKKAYQHIRENGLSPQDIRVILGASGAAKWLVLYGLDKAIFSCWLKGVDHKISLFGTSVGAWKFAAACQNDPANGLTRLKDAYIHQYYPETVTREMVSRQSEQVMGRFLPREKIGDVLSHPVFKLGFSSVRCRHLTVLENRVLLGLGLLFAFGLNCVSRRSQALFFNRTLFHVPGYSYGDLDMTGFGLNRVVLDPHNLVPALQATGSIPLIMKGVRHIPGAPGGMYRDGGILDYHPAFSLAGDVKGFILYPHFYSTITPGWFDKQFPRRRALGALMDRTIILSPSPEFVADLPHGRIPDRQDFYRFKGKDAHRVAAWKKAVRASLALGDEFLEAIETGKIKTRVSPLV